MEEEFKRAQERSVDLKIRQDEELRDLARRVEDEEYQRYQANLVNIEAKIQAMEEGNDLFNKRNVELVEEYKVR